MHAKCEGRLKDLKFVSKATVVTHDDEDGDDAYSDLKNAELKELCKDRGLKVSGKKQELVDRLKDDDWEKARQATIRYWPFAQTAAANELATMPAMESLFLKVCDLILVPVSNPRGVTVKDVMDVLYYGIFQSSAWQYQGKLGRVTGKRNGMSWLDFDDHEPDDCTLAMAYLAGVVFKGFDGQKTKQVTKEFVLCWKEQAMKEDDEYYVKTASWVEK